MSGSLATPTPVVVFKALADETRVRLALLIVNEGELCVCELVCALQASQPKISRHLAELRNAGLLQDRRQGLWVYYRLHDALPGWVKQILLTTLEARRDWLSDDLERLQAMGDRPVRRVSCC
jgi:ArsR family transcriptional regulator, arsenate/arsenite/antimonite-responsive transcriptional repressor